MGKEVESNYYSYMDIYTDMRLKFKWKLPSQVLGMLPLIYVINDKKFDMELYEDVVDYIKKNTGFFSPIKSQQTYSIAALLISNYEDPKYKFDQLLVCIDKMKEYGFKKGPYLGISSFILLEEKDLDKRLENTSKIFKGMKENHKFLTSQDDYPLAIMLAKDLKDEEKVILDMEYYYASLAETKFKKGNELQLMSQLLTLSESDLRDSIVERCKEMYNIFKQNNIKVRRVLYPSIALLVLFNVDLEKEINTLKDLINRFKNEKHFKWNRDINIILSIILLLLNTIDKNKNDKTIETGLNTIIQNIIQAQQIAMIAAIGASTSFTGSSSN
ncbi:DUF4003 family protein [Clostridiisalibacter paucivorans]|uniref:DUF4003 family protein n=1 Tax=Clostridiisalibacter paucivorans TaxID=408753 RepID=UPI00047D4A39|nr:DUF4003 family protein [Clostridiisalibacter paucivorans]